MQTTSLVSTTERQDSFEDQCNLHTLKTDSHLEVYTTTNNRT